MKKRILTVILLGCMALSLIGCGGNTDTPQNDKEPTNTKTETESEMTAESEESEKAQIDFYYTHKVPGKNIVIDAPNYQNVELGYTELYIIHESKYVAFTYNKLEQPETLEDAHKAAYDMFLLSVDNYSFGELTVTKEEYVTIDGIDMYRYEGTIKEGYGDNKYDCYALGYSFIMDGVPCTVGGAVIEESQSEELIKEIHDTIEAMIRTLRSER